MVWIAIVGIGSTVFIGTRCYSRTSTAAALPPLEVESIPGYRRARVFTYLTLPEWFIVYNSDEFATHVAERPPSSFPYIRSARQYWSYYSSVCSATRGVYPFETGYHAMLGVIGASFTVESSLKAVYENTVGRLTERFSSTDTAEDALARRTAKDYGTFMHAVPWYEFPFSSKLKELWRDTPLRGPHMLRKIERRFALTAEYGVKAAYGWVIGQATGAAYATEDLRIHARIEDATAEVFKDPRIKPVKPLGSGSYLVTLPRYEEFTRAALALTGMGVRFADIAGNDEILITVLARRGIDPAVPRGRLVAAHPILTDATMQRLAYSIPVSALGEISQHFAPMHAVVEHVYDY